MDNETREKANKLVEQISRMQNRITDCEVIRDKKKNNNCYFSSTTKVFVPEMLEDSILLMIESFWKAELMKLEKEFVEL